MAQCEKVIKTWVPKLRAPLTYVNIEIRAYPELQILCAGWKIGAPLDITLSAMGLGRGVAEFFFSSIGKLRGTCRPPGERIKIFHPSMAE